MATCPKNPKHQTSIVFNDGKVDASVSRYKEDDTSADAPKDGYNSSERHAAEHL